MNQIIDYWAIDQNSQSAYLGEFKKTNNGFLLSLLQMEWSKVQEPWINSFRIYPKIIINKIYSNKLGEKELQIEASKIQQLLELQADNSRISLPLEHLNKFNQKIRLLAWRNIRDFLEKDISLNFETFGVNKITTIDYLNLQALGIKEYQKIIGNIENAKPLTIRDRIAYARRHNWIPAVGHGQSSPEMNKFA
jgi:hypothetical protein